MCGAGLPLHSPPPFDMSNSSRLRRRSLSSDSDASESVKRPKTCTARVVIRCVLKEPVTHKWRHNIASSHNKICQWQDGYRVPCPLSDGDDFYVVCPSEHAARAATALSRVIAHASTGQFWAETTEVTTYPLEEQVPPRDCERLRLFATGPPVGLIRSLLTMEQTVARGIRDVTFPDDVPTPAGHIAIDTSVFTANKIVQTGVGAHGNDFYIGLYHPDGSRYAPGFSTGLSLHRPQAEPGPPVRPARAPSPVRPAQLASTAEAPAAPPGPPPAQPRRRRRARRALRAAQCWSCQKFGHDAQNCTAATPTCRRCAGHHRSSACDKRGDAPLCANCSGRHAASSRECPLRPRDEPRPPPPGRPPARHSGRSSQALQAVSPDLAVASLLTFLFGRLSPGAPWRPGRRRRRRSRPRPHPRRP